MGTHKTPGHAHISARLKKYAVPGVVSVDVIKSNIVTDAIPPSIDRIAVANIDVDIYEAVAAALSKIAR